MQVKPWYKTTYSSGRCNAPPGDLDNPNASLRTREKTADLLATKDPDSLWYDHGIVPDLQVSCRNTVTHRD